MSSQTPGAPAPGAAGSTGTGAAPGAAGNTGTGTAPSAAGSTGTGARPARSLRRTLAAAVLAFEGLVVFFAALVAKDLSSLTVGQALGFGGALAVACLVGAGLLRAPAGYALGWVLQVLILITGVWVPMMYFLAVLFGALWWTALRVGLRIDREKAAYAEAAAGGASSPA